MKASILRTAGLLSGVAVQIAGQGLFNCRDAIVRSRGKTHL